MLASITPLGERSRRQRWPITVSALIVGGAAAGSLAGAGLAALGRLAPLPAGTRFDVLVALGTAATVVELHPFGIRLPPHRRQVDETWLHRYRGWVYGIGFGAQLGVGVWTIVATPAIYVALAGEALAPTVAAGVAIGATFGFVRGATVLSTVRVDTPEALSSFHRRFHRSGRLAALLAFGAQALVLVAAAAVIL